MIVFWLFVWVGAAAFMSASRGFGDPWSIICFALVAGHAYAARTTPEGQE